MKRYTDLNTYFRSRFGCRVQKITLDAGLTCPNRDGSLSSEGCIFCNAHGSGTAAHRRGVSITEQLLRGQEALKRRYKAKAFMAYFQSFSNTYGPVDTLRSLYDEALAVPNVVGLSIGTRPDCVSPAILDLLQTYATQHLVWIEYGVQSAHDRTLARINRGHTFSDFEKAVHATAGRGIDICAHVILGLPGERRQDMHQTARMLSHLPIDGIKLHLLYVIKETRMEALYRSGKYRCLDQSEYVDLVCDFLERIPSRLVIQRLTGDPHRNELVAPEWSLRKNETLQLIHRRLQERDTWQGKLAASDDRGI